MIVDKYIKQKPNIIDAGDNPMLPDDDNITLEEVTDNPLIEVYKATRRVLESLHIIPDDTNSPKLFQTVKIDNGQFERIVRSKGNTEYAIGFPAAFIRFTNVRYLVAQQRFKNPRSSAISRTRVLVSPPMGRIIRSRIVCESPQRKKDWSLSESAPFVMYLHHRRKGLLHRRL